MFNPGIQALSVFNDGTIYQIDGADISPGSTFEFTDITRRNARGGEAVWNKSVVVTMQHSDAEFHANVLEANGMDWELAIAGFNWVGVCYNKNHIKGDTTPQADPTSNEYPFTFKYELLSAPKSAAGINLISTYIRSQGYTFWADEDNDEIVDGFINSGVESPSFGLSLGNLVQTLWNSSAGGNFYIDIPFPINGVGVLATVNIREFSTGNNPFFALKALEFDNSVVLSNATGFSSTGIKTSPFDGSLAIPNSSDMYKWRIGFEDATDPYDLSFNDIVARIDGKSDYIRL